MGKIFTHYDNLKVSRDAPREVIEAAFQSLCEKYHPDKYPGSQQAAERMLLIRRAYEILSDPELRREHDAWIVKEERAARDAENAASHRAYWAQRQERETNSPKGKSTARRAPIKGHSLLAQLKRHASNRWQYYLIAVGLTYVVLVNYSVLIPPVPSRQPYLSSPSVPPVIKPNLPVIRYQRPATTPYGYPWPTDADYLAGATMLNNTGLSTVTVDNTQTGDDYHVKLVFLDAPQAFPVREFFVPAHGVFTMEHVSAGHYELRYRNLTTGVLTRQDPFRVHETLSETGTTHDNVRSTLYSVVNGNTRSHPLNDKDF